MSPATGTLRRTITSLALFLLALALALATIHAVFSQAGPAAAAMAAMGLSALGILWSVTAIGRARERARYESAAQAADAELRKLRRMMTQQQSTAKKLVERDLELSHANDQLREIDQMKSEFVTVATHQLRTPLSAIRWTIHMLLSGDVGPLTEEQRKFLEQAYESNNRLITLLHDILLTDRIESGKVEHEGKLTDPAEVIGTLLQEVGVLAQRQNVTLRFAPPETPCPPLAIEPDHLHTVLQNLVENAIQYSKEKGEVIVRLTHEPDKAIIAVADNGIGIPREMQHHIFTRFYRAANAVRTVTDGTGLGLYIAKRIVEHEGGTIRFDSTEGVGSTFFVTFRLADVSTPGASAIPQEKL